MSTQDRSKLDQAITAILVASPGTWHMAAIIAQGLRHIGIHVDGRAIWRSMVRIATHPPKGYVFDWSQGTGQHLPAITGGSRARPVIADEYRLMVV